MLTLMTINSSDSKVVVIHKSAKCLAMIKKAVFNAGLVLHLCTASTEINTLVIVFHTKYPA